MKRISNKEVVYAMSKDNDPVLAIESGERVYLETLDCFSNQIKTEEDKVGEIDFAKVNPGTGPIYIKDAQPGDVLKVTIHRIDLKEQGVSIVSPGMGVLHDQIKEEVSVVIPVKDKKIIFRDYEFPIAPMVGVIGTAPKGEDVPTGFAGPHGGNMDCPRITEGAIVYLPVNVPGALFAAGDLHAAMGDGEVSISGVEISGGIDITLEVLKDTKIPTPSVHSQGVWSYIYTDVSPKVAAKTAVEGMVAYLEKELNLTFEESLMLVSDVGDLKYCSTGDAFTVSRVEFPDKYLKLP
ncbi:MAG: acetamidase/formamidase family protein [Tissierellia bacterium]|nr:acetamidase/formamidase family protein [Tissierellia bacterium]